MTHANLGTVLLEGGGMLALALLGVTCPPEASPTISVIEGSLSVLVTEVGGGIQIENLSDVDCIVFVRSPEGEQLFELGAGESITLTGITKPIEVGAVKR